MQAKYTFLHYYTDIIFKKILHFFLIFFLQAQIDKEGLHLKLNVSHYEPKDLSIKVVGNRLIISGKHEKKSDEHGFVTREFTRELMIPEVINT